MNDIQTQLLTIFREEAADHLATLRKYLMALETDAHLPPNSIDEAFRAAHTLKGAARAVDLTGIETLTHHMETLFDFCRKDLFEVSALVEPLRSALDAIEDAAASGSSEPTHPHIKTFEDLVESLHTPQKTKTEPETKIEPEAKTTTPSEYQTDTVRVDVRALDRLLESVGQLQSEHTRQNHLNQMLVTLNRNQAALKRDWAQMRAKMHTQKTQNNGQLTSEWLRETERKLHDLSTQSQTLATTHQEHTWYLQRLGKQLIDDVHRTRLVAAESVFGAFGPHIRDLAKQFNKKVSVRLLGLETRADRTVLQTLKDPLMHMLRNAVDHGIELPDKRKAAGKPPEGLVELRVVNQDGRLHISVKDDGQGIHTEHLTQTARRKGLITNDAPDNVIDLIFQAGFSTAKHVTEISGRGIGLSVARTAVTQLQGALSVQTAPNEGTTITMSVPLSVAMHRLLLLLCNGQAMAIPTHGIDRLYRIPSSKLSGDKEHPLVVLNNQSMKLHDLSTVLGLPATAHANILPVAVLKSGDRKTAVVVEKFLGVHDGLIQSLPAMQQHQRWVVGGVLQNDGSVAPVLNPAEIIETASGVTAGLIHGTPTTPDNDAPPTILVVDDSVTTRTLETSILEAHGYRVYAAVNGLEALEQLHSHPIDLVVSDVQMPHLDGFGLVSRMRKDPKLAHIPAILVTSLDNEEHRQQGLEAGADAYIVKQKFDQHDLINTIRQML